jgi:hypothetical protein
MDTEIQEASAQLSELRKLDQRAYFNFICGIASALAAAQRRELFPAGSDASEAPRLTEPFPHGTADVAKLAASMGLTPSEAEGVAKLAQREATVVATVASLSPDNHKVLDGMIASHERAAFLSDHRDA